MTLVSLQLSFAVLFYIALPLQTLPDPFLVTDDYDDDDDDDDDEVSSNTLY